MATSLQLDIVTPERNVFSGTVSQVVIPAWNGQMGVLPEHDALLALLRGGIAIAHTPSGEVRYVVGRGFAEIGPTQVTLLTDSCERADEIDKAAAARELQAAEKELDESSAYGERAAALEVRLELARARVEV